MAVTHYELWFDIDESPVWIPKDLAAEEQVRMIAEAVAKPKDKWWLFVWLKRFIDRRLP